MLPSSPEAPLLSEQRSPLRSSPHPSQEDTSIFNESTSTDYDYDSIEATETGTYLIIIVGAAAIGGLLFGYDTGVISGVLVSIGNDLGGVPPSNHSKELITSITSAGAFLGAIIAGSLSDKMGRKYTLVSCCLVFFLSSILMAFSSSVLMLTIGRAIVGIAVGGSSMVVPVYIAEVSPSAHRGRLITLNSVSVTGGQLIAYILAIYFDRLKGGWRYMLGLGTVPPFVFMLLVGFIPESPRLLVMKGDTMHAGKALHKIFPNATKSQVQDKLILIQNDLKHLNLSEKKPIKYYLLKLFTIPSNFRALSIACGLMASQQLCGFNAFMYYSSTLFAMVGFEDAISASVVVAMTNFLFTFVAIKYVDTVGKRKMLLGTMWILVITLLIVAVTFLYLPLDDNLNVITEKAAPWARNTLLVAIMIYVAVYAAALGNVPWSSIEFLPLEVRSLGSMFMSCTNWLFNVVISGSYLSMMSKFTPSGTFLFYAILVFLSYVGIWYCYPEVSNIPLEDIRHVFIQGFGSIVHNAEVLRKEQKQLQVTRSLPTGLVDARQYTGVANENSERASSIDSDSFTIDYSD